MQQEALRVDGQLDGIIDERERDERQGQGQGQEQRANLLDVLFPA